MTVQPAVPGQQNEVKRNRRIIRVAVLLGLLSAVIFGGGYWFIGSPKFGPSTVTNNSGAVSVAVPAGWIATTPWNSPRTVWPLVGGPSRVAWPTLRGSHRVEDIRLGTGAPSSQTQITISMDIADKKLTNMHARDVGADLEKNAVAVASPVRGRHRSLASVSSRSDMVVEIVTLRSQHYVVTAAVSAPNEGALEAANDVLGTLTVRDDK